MTKEELREAIIHRASGSFLDADSMTRFHPNVVDIWIEMAIGNIFRASFKGLNEFELDSFTREVVDIPVLKDDNGRYYCVMPKRYTQLPDNSGIRYVRDNVADNNNDVKHYELSTVNAENAFSDLEVGQLSGQRTAIIHGDRIFFHHFDDEYGKVAMGIIPAWGSYADDDMVQLPSGGEMQFIEAVFSLVAGTKQADQSIDNVSN